MKCLKLGNIEKVGKSCKNDLQYEIKNSALCTDGCADDVEFTGSRPGAAVVTDKGMNPLLRILLYIFVGYSALVEHIGMLHYRPELTSSTPKSRLGQKNDLRDENGEEVNDGV